MVRTQNSDQVISPNFPAKQVVSVRHIHSKARPISSNKPYFQYELAQICTFQIQCHQHLSGDNEALFLLDKTLIIVHRGILTILNKPSLRLTYQQARDIPTFDRMIIFVSFMPRMRVFYALWIARSDANNSAIGARLGRFSRLVCEPQDCSYFR